MKNTKKIALAAMSLVAAGVAAAGATGTFAWFAANNKVTVDGMSFQTKVSSNLFIAGDVIDSDAKKADVDFVSEAHAGLQEILEPVSTVNAINYFYTNEDVKADGSTTDDEFNAYDPAAAATDTDTYGDKFSEDYSLTKTAANATITGKQKALGYIDYVFQLKAINPTASALDINMTALNLVYTKSGTEIDQAKAERIAFFVDDITDGTVLDELTSANVASGKYGLNGIYAPAGATNFEGKAISDVDERTAITYVSSGTAMASVAANTTAWYKVVARLWIEGQDTTCKNDIYLNLVGKWDLDMKFELGTGSKVNNIAKYMKFTASNSTVYFSDGTNAYTEVGGTALTSSGLNNAELEAELEGAFGITIA